VLKVGTCVEGPLQ